MARKLRKEASIEWLDQPEEGNYPAAISYLSLSLPPKRAKKLVAQLRDAPFRS